MTDKERGWRAPPPNDLFAPLGQPSDGSQRSLSEQFGHPSLLEVPPPPQPQPQPPEPAQLRLIAGLLILNLALSILVTVVSVFARHSIVNYQLDHRHITDPALRERLRSSYGAAIVGRVVGNIVASVVYVFLVRALYRGRRWAHRRVIWLGSVGGLALLLAQATPYPPWLRAEQLSQAVVLGVMVFLVTRPAVRAYFATGLPGRDVRRFRKQH